MLETKTEVFCGVARLPSEMASAEPSSYLAIELEIDMDCQVITDLGFTACPTLCESLLRTLLVGNNLVEGVQSARLVIEERYHGSGKRAVVAALNNALQEYEKRKANA